DDHVAGGSIGPTDQATARLARLKYNTGSSREGVGPRRVGADEVALDEVVRAALEEESGITARYDIALAGQRAADPARGGFKSEIDKHATAAAARNQAGGISADEATFNDDVGGLNQNAYARAVINHQAAKDAAAAREDQAIAAPNDCDADFDQQHGIVTVGQRVGAGTGLRVAVNDDWT